MSAPTEAHNRVEGPHGQSGAPYTITWGVPDAEVLDTGTASAADALRIFEDITASCDQEMRRDASTTTVQMTYGDGLSTSREVGARDPWAASGHQYWGRALKSNGITNDVDVDVAGGRIYVPFVVIGTAWRVYITDDAPGTFLAVFSTNEQAEAREGDEIRSDYGLTGAGVIDFVRAAISHADAEVYPNGNPFTAAVANTTTCLYCLKPYDPTDSAAKCAECGEPR